MTSELLVSSLGWTFLTVTLILLYLISSMARVTSWLLSRLRSSRLKERLGLVLVQ